MRIAHLSDFHMRRALPLATVNPNPYLRAIPELLEKAVAHIQTLRPDLLAVTGDLIDYPLDEMDNPERLAQGEEDLRLLRQLLDLAGCPLAVVYGNHDHPALYDKVFGDLSQDFVCNGHRVLTFYDAEDEAHVPHRRGAERNRFQAALTDADPLPQIHIQHYLLWPQMEEEYPYNYPDSTDLRAAMTESGKVRLSLSGHYHLGVTPTPVFDVSFAGVPAFCDPPHPLWVYDLTNPDISAAEYSISL